MKNFSRRGFIETITLTGALASLSSAEEMDSTGIYRNLETRINTEETMKKLQRKNIANLKGMAIQDPSNKQNVRGFVYIPTVFGEQLKFLETTSTFYWSERFRTPPRANIGLVEAIKKYTDINAYSDKHLFLSSPHLIEYPFLYIATDQAFELTNIERNNFENYLRNGGFAVLESLEPELNYGQAESSLKQMTRDVLKKDARFLPIPNSHKLYHCFFDFNEGPPQGIEVNPVTTGTSNSGAGVNWQNFTFPKPRYYLEGIFLDNRLAVVYSGKGYGKKWKDILGSEPQQKMGVNFVVYVLTQKGGIAQKVEKINIL